MRLCAVPHRFSPVELALGGCNQSLLCKQQCNNRLLSLGLRLWALCAASGDKGIRVIGTSQQQHLLLLVLGKCCKRTAQICMPALLYV